MEGTIRTPDTSSVIVGVDGSKPARAAALWAADEAARRGRPLHVLYAADTDNKALYLSAHTVDGIRAAGRTLLDDTARAVTAAHPDLQVTTEFSRHDAVTALHAAGGPYGTVVVGSRGLGGFNSLMLGSIGLKTAAGARTPVVVVRGNGDGAETGVVLAAVRDEHDLVCARYAAREAELRKASLRLLHVWSLLESVGNVVGQLDAVDELAQEHVRHLTAVADQVHEEFPALRVHADAEKSVSVGGVLVEATRHADLLVMGGRRERGFIGTTLGRATHTLVHHAHCPVLLIPRMPEPKEEEAS
ncbi:universal stress protein [Streptomyces sp. NRRL S-87]|uniref:universal stress protein n=1 Tax=Streptomyces sp. NRRL S-87 TaxID=1463920 RepID=UPI000691F5A3|nr:universal stress protein [Streptomyces sp. NRRL S-87]